MSCGEPHEVDCREVLSEVYFYLDAECADARRKIIQHHLDECSPCLREFGIEQEVRALVHRCCSSEVAPNGLKDRLRAKLSGLDFPR
ncbi:anti-sigma factor RsrA [Actinorhabdospora filicis]|uniref:Anti-sigma factor RsrA n=1 Tax=Actinorhabdospora filicis TaxID=1785913 RepID=A0A9W6SFC2_9ACTN|nr:mycothiol system anti-sigma-R factor [Actinorhabdospora filicis]GLZ76124.1 anti-sigma factor RsrA [Actinorhabdospora filicis]